MDTIANFLKDLVLDMVETNLNTLYTVLYMGFKQVKDDITVTPKEWLGGTAWDYMEQVHSNVMVPIGALILTFILVVELHHIVIERNAMKDIHIPELFMYFFKMAIGLIIVLKAPDIVLGIFDIGNWAVVKTIGIIPMTMSNPADMAAAVRQNLSANCNLGTCVGFWLTVSISTWIAIAINIIAMVIVYGRLMQMTMYASVSSVPLSTFMNKDWNVGQNYIKNLFALAFQGFLIVFIVGVFSIVMSNPQIDTGGDILDLTMSIMGHIGWGVLLCMMLIKTNTITQSIFGAH